MTLAVRHRYKTSCLLIGAMLFTQAALVAQACVETEARPSMAFTGNMAEHGCDEAAATPVPNPNACLQHCTGSDQTTAQVPLPVAAMPADAVLDVPVASESDSRFADVALCDLHSPDPPPSIRFCSFQL